MKDAFALAEQSPRYDELMALTPEASVLDYVVLLVLMTLGTAGAAALGFHFLSDDPMTQLLLVATVLLVGLASLGFTWSRMRRYQAAPIERQVALVRDETVETTVQNTVHAARNGRSPRVSTRVTNEYYSSGLGEARPSGCPGSIGSPVARSRFTGKATSSCSSRARRPPTHSGGRCHSGSSSGPSMTTSTWAIARSLTSAGTRSSERPVPARHEHRLVDPQGQKPARR